MRTVNVKPLFCALVLALSVAPASSETFDNEFDEKPWVEVEVQLPAFPEKENLIEFKVGTARERRFLIDSKSVSVGPDGVIRYTLIVISSAGAENISYEGMRCGVGERRFYAFGRSDRTWSKARSNQWPKIKGTNDHHQVELYVNYFCPTGAAAITSADHARRVLRAGGQPVSSGR